MSVDPSRSQTLADAGRDADARFGDAPIGTHARPCLDHPELIEILFDDPFRGPSRNVLVQLVYPSGTKESLRTDIRGAIRIKKARGKLADTSYRRDGNVQKRRVYLRPEDASGESAAWQRLVNLGYVLDAKPPPAPDSPMKLLRAVQAFQADFQLEVTGTLDEATKKRITAEHADPTPWQNREWARPPEPKPDDKNVKESIA